MAGSDNTMTYWQALEAFANSPVTTIFDDVGFVMGVTDPSTGIGYQLELDGNGIPTIAQQAGIPSNPLQVGLNAVTGRLTASQIQSISQQAADATKKIGGDATAQANAAQAVIDFVNNHEGGSAEQALADATHSTTSFLTYAFIGIAIIAGAYILFEAKKAI